ncbi:hypothetical protein JCM3765_001712 [Sporobolomyces pararoseus]
MNPPSTSHSSSEPVGQLRTVSHNPVSTVTTSTTTTENKSTFQNFPASSSSSFSPHSSMTFHPSTRHTNLPTTATTANSRMKEDLLQHQQQENDYDQSGEEGNSEDDGFAELRILPSTTTSIVTTTTTMTTHFAPIKIPKTSRSSSSAKSSLVGLRELIDREEEGSANGEKLDLKSFPLSQTGWESSGLGNFKVELGELTARFQHNSREKGKGQSTTTVGGNSGVAGKRDIKGKGKETIGGSRKFEESSRRITSPTATTSTTDRRGSSTTMRHSPGPPPRKRPRSDMNDVELGTENKAVSLPSPPNQSPPSPVPTSGGGDESQENLPGFTSTSIREQQQQITPPPQTFNLGQSPAIPALLSLPDLVDTFDQLSPSLQSYLIFTLLRRSSIPVLQTVANIISPALRRDFLSDLPPELSVQILGYLDPTTLVRASLVCKNWRRLVDGEWRVWKKMMDLDGLWIGDGSEEKEAREIVTGKKENWFLERWKAGVWDQNKKSAWDGKVEPDSNYVDPSQQQTLRRPSISTSSIRPASPSSSREPSLSPPPPEISHSHHSVHPYKILYRRRWLTRRNWKQSEPKRTTFTSSTATTNVVTCLQFDEEKIVSASDDADHSIHVFDTQSGSERAELRGHEGGVWALQYVGNVLVSGSTDRTVRVWDLDSAKCTHVFLGHTSTVRCLQIVEPINVNSDPNGEPIWEPPYPLVVTGSRDWSLRVWKLPFAGKDREYHPAEPMSPTEGGGAQDGEPTDNPYYEKTLSGHRHAVRAVAAAGRTVVSGSYDHNVRVWDLLTGECQHVLEGHTAKVYSVVLDHYRKQCASGSMDGTVKLWSTETGEQLHSLDGHSSLVGLLGLSRRCLVSAAADWTLRIWNPETGECRHALNAHQGAITCFQHDEYKIVSGSDGTLKMWDTQTGEFVRDLLANLTGVWQVAFNQRYCIAAVQRNGASEFELLDFGSVSEDEIKLVDQTATTTTRRPIPSTPSPPTPTRDLERDPSPTFADDHDTDMTDSSHVPHHSTSSSSSTRKPPALQGPAQTSRFRSVNSGTTTPDNRSEGEATTATLRRIESSRSLTRHSNFGGNDNTPTIQANGTSSSMDVDREDREDGALERSSTREETRGEDSE